MPALSRRAALLALPFLSCIRPALAAPEALTGTYALPEGRAAVSASLAVSGGPAAGPHVLDIAMTRLGNTRPITRYAVELSKQLHVIAVSADGRTFLHEHGERAGADGHFRIPMRFPVGGSWHIYADAVPTGLPQQVMRFDLVLDGTAPPTPPPTPTPTGLEGQDGPYTIRFDTLDLRAGQDAALTLHVLRDGRPAADLTPYLGVAAHAVFIDAANGTYIHAHAAPSGGVAMPGGHHDMAGMPGMDAPPPPPPPPQNPPRAAHQAGADAAPARPGRRHLPALGPVPRRWRGAHGALRGRRGLVPG